MGRAVGPQYFAPKILVKPGRVYRLRLIQTGTKQRNPVKKPGFVVLYGLISYDFWMESFTSSAVLLTFDLAPL